MDEQLLNELYGIDPNEQYDANDEMIKAAQAELIEAVADEAGIDLNEMDDDELEKFASYVLAGETADDEFVEDDMFAQADQMGRVMAHAYADEQEKIAAYQLAEAGYEDVLEKTASTWEMMKIAKTTGEFTGMGDRAFKDLSNYEKRLIAGRRFGKDGTDKRTLSDVGVRKRDYLRSLVGRGTGYYDIQSARQIGKEMRADRGKMTATQLKDFDKLRRSKEIRDITKSFSAKDLAALDAIIASKGLSQRYKTGLSAEGAAILDRLSDAQLDALDATRAAKVRRGLMLRGGGKMALTAAGIGALGYGASRVMGNK